MLIGQVGQPLEAGTKKERQRSSPTSSAGAKLYVAQVEKKPVEGLEKGAIVKIAIQKETIGSVANALSALW